MSRILYAWELGGGLGHVTVFLPVARELMQRGHQVTWALRDLQVAVPALGRDEHALLQAPVWRHQVLGLPENTLSFAEILFRCGYLLQSTLQPLLRAWIELLRSCQPDLVIADFSPTAQLAARALGIPCARIGAGYWCPPATDPVSNLMPWAPAPQERMLDAGRTLLDSVNTALADMGFAQLASVADVSRTDEDFLITYAELDHFRGRQGHYYGPISSDSRGVPPVWPEGGGARVFAYVKGGEPHVEALLTALLDRHCSTLVFATGLPEAVRARVECPSLRISAAPYAMQETIAGCDLAICHAGHGTICAALCAGKPLLLLPGFLEQEINARNVVDLGAGLGALRDEPEAAAVEALQRLLSDASFGAAARAFANRYATTTQAGTVTAITDRCEALLAAPPPASLSRLPGAGA